MVRYLTVENKSLYHAMSARESASFMLLVYRLFQLRLLLSVHCGRKLELVNQANAAMDLWRKFPDKCKLIQSAIASGDLDRAGWCYISGIALVELSMWMGSSTDLHVVPI